MGARYVKRTTQGHAFPLTIVGAELFLIGLALFGLARLDWWKALELGILEGVTEFLPISSTAHLLIATNLLNFEVTEKGTFEIFIQLGAVIAVAGFYARALLAQARALPVRSETRHFWLGILMAFLPAAVTGVLLHSWIKAVLFSPPVIAVALILGGIVFLVVEHLPERPSTVHTVQGISLRQALGIGLAQTLAIIPGVSRSGASIIGGMLAGLDRQTATAFSFYLAIPTLGAATIYELLTSLSSLTPGDMGLLLLGMVVSLVVAWLSIDWLLRYVATNSFVAFGIYRIGAGIVILALIAWGKL
ncbi:MAG: undecaprenyl-diphosphate phosphatase [Chloroflexaceae bacterium]|nr:undecaprenyl-diphosphate phosphatase [Chloroflexaceae bacterium]